MCGIAAIFAYSADAPGVDRDELVAIRDHMIARGPDGFGEWISQDRRIGLAHRRLSIIDLSDAGAQPMWSADRTLCVIFNGEIYNYRELRSRLQAQGCTFRSNCDTEVLLHLYAHKGANMVHDLRGMYAFAIWDSVKRSLFLARDPFGIKPLYYADDGRTIRVASQVKALLQSKHIDTAPEPAGHVGFFLWGSVPDPFTLYRGIKALPAGHTLTIAALDTRHSTFDTPEPRSFCSIPEILRAGPQHPSPPRPGRGLGEVSNLLRESLRDSIAQHLISDVPVGVFQSAGLDSSTVTAFVSEVHSHIRTVTLGFNEYRGTQNDEVPLAEAVARNCGTDHRTIWVSKADFESDAEALLQAMDQPSIDGVNTYFVSKAARQAGLKVALSGLGGDELFGGYPSFRDVPRIARTFRPFGAMPALGRGFRIVSGQVLKRFTSPKYAGIFEYGSTHAGAYLLRRGLFMPWELPGILDPELVREGWQRLNTLPALDATADLSAFPLRLERGEGQGEVPNSSARIARHTSRFTDRLRISALELTWYMRNQLLRDADWAGMAHSLEIRVPLVDLQLLRSLLPALSSDAPPSKLDMAHAPRSPLPAALLSRAKTGFTVPVREWLLRSPLRLERGEGQGEVSNSPSHDRGLRGWARHVYSNFGGTLLKGQTPRIRTGLGSTPDSGVTFGDSPKVSGSQLSTINNPLLGARRILIYRIGQLGDTIVALPSMWAVRKQFPKAHLALLSDSHRKSGYVRSTDLLDGSGIFDEYLDYPVETGVRKTMQGWQLIRDLRKREFDTVVYLAPSNRSPRQVARDRWFFRAAGIQTFIGMDGFPELPSRRLGLPLENSPREVDLLLKRVSFSGVTAAKNPPEFELRVGVREEALVQEWVSSQTRSDEGRPWLAVGPGSKMPAKQWPADRFQKVVRELITQFDVWPVVFGGPEDAQTAEALLQNWKRGYNAAGALDVRSAALALKRCVLYLGNDTGTMHLAASVAIPCVAIFSARERPGRWYPHGDNHQVLRADVECEGCGLIECVERRNECLLLISAEEAMRCCRKILVNRHSNPLPDKLAGRR
jgi:asparagine synthase (glutamine-hydrolysing)